MSIGTADLQKAIITVWNASGLNALFEALGGESPILQDQEAIPSQAYPYCVLNQPTISTDTRMSDDSGNRHIRDVSQSFSVFTSIVSGDSRTPKELAAISNPARPGLALNREP